MKTVIVTGASSGVGKAIAQYFLENGWNVVMNASNAENLQKTYESFGSPTAAVCVVGDIADKSTGELLVTTALDVFGSVDVLINNAGVFAPKPFLEVEEADIDRFYGVNLKGTFFASQSAIRKMLLAGGGSIINIGTVLVDHAIGGFPASAAVVSKGGVHALTRQLAAEFGKQNIRVNTLALGIIRSPLQAKIGVQDSDSLAGLHLLNRIGEGRNVAELAYSVATNDFISGEIINLDGGHIAGHHLS
ncbi:MAG: SDR family NAD(P)-dependent oxidoreductase [Spirosomataceae bacterium]